MRAAVDVAARAIFTRRASARRLALTVVLWSVAAATADGGDILRGKEIAAGRCAICHGADGESASPLFPWLAGQLRHFEQRPVTAGNAAMHVVAAKLGGGDAHAAAEFIATLD